VSVFGKSQFGETKGWTVGTR